MRALMVVAVVLAPHSARADAPEAELIFYNGRVETLDANFTRARAIAVAGGHILAVGDLGAIMPLGGPATRKVNLHGLALLPGFVDPHQHRFNHLEDLGGLDASQQLMLSNGITTAGELLVNRVLLDLMLAYHAEGRLKVRTSLYLNRTSNCGELRPPTYRDVAPIFDPEAVLRIPGVKILSDGGSCLRPATTFEVPLPDGPTTGDLFFEADELYELASDAASYGYQVAIHAVGDRARDVAFEALERLLDGGPNTMRHRIEHTVWVRPDQIQRHVDSGILTTGFIDRTCLTNAGMTPFINHMPEFTRPWYRPWHDMLAVGVLLSWKSDAPDLTSDPMQQLYNIVTRKEVDVDGSICEPPSWMTDTGPVTTAQALRMMTSAGAYALHMETAVGSLEPGKLADFVVLSEDPLEVEPDDLKDLTVLSTVIGGVSLYCAPGSEALCH